MGNCFTKADETVANTKKNSQVSDANPQKKNAARLAVQGVVNENASLPSFYKSDKVREEILGAMSKNNLFTMLDEDTRSKVVDTMKRVQYQANQVVILQGAKDKSAEQFFVLEEGMCEVFKNDDVRLVTPSRDTWGAKLPVMYGAGSSFGELALMYSALRAATVVTARPTVAWIMERQHYLVLKRQYFQAVYKEKIELLEKVPSFQMLKEAQMDLLLDAMESVSFEPGSHIISQGQAGDEFFIISEGCVSIQVDGQMVNRLSPGAFFGERALIKDENRAADVIALDHVKCMKLDRDAFIAILGPMEHLFKIATLQNVPMLCTLEEEDLMKLVDVLEEVKIATGDVVYNKGDASDSIYFVSEGAVKLTNPADPTRAVETLHVGDYFGEKGLLTNDLRPFTATCITDGLVMRLSMNSLTTAVGDIHDLQRRWREGILEKVDIFKALSTEQMTKLARKLRSAKIEDQESIVTKGESGDTFFIIESGKVNILAADGKTVVATLKQGSFFGERALITNEVRNASVEADGPVQLLQVDRKTFMDVLGDSKALFQECLAQRESKDNDMKVTMADLKMMAVLGIGAFGRVTLVKHHKALYALKAMCKHHVIEKNMLAHVNREKETMKDLNCPFTVNLVASLQDKDNLYMMMERVMGGEFFFFLHNLERPLHEQHCRFYAACVIQGMAHIHSKDYMFRDLKPENLLMDSTGYLKIADFGFAKKLVKGKSFTLCGTPDYLAPELITQTGHNHAVDWWAVGVLIYEICTRNTPFAADDQLKLLFNITSLNINWAPLKGLSPEVKDLISKFLNKNPAQRMGSQKGGVAKIKAHPWFRGFDWEALENRTMKAPYVPDLKSPGDTSMFECIPSDSEVPGSDTEWSQDTLTAVRKPETFADW